MAGRHLNIPPLTKQDILRFWERIRIRRLGKCWKWRVGKTADGYGELWLAKAAGVFRAHRVAWVISNGPIPTDLFVLHHCDNRDCCNPQHLFLGTNADNMQDAARKGRIANGEKRWNAKLTAKQVRAIRKDYIPNNRARGMHGLANRWGVNQRTIYDIIHHRTWSHVK